ncbi:outer membrane protein assembly factor BamB [Xylophilus sp.]|uniref:outer membrane protein assembly factor BamB n=1 Tax=Xylophilus sp. TaxID=2653893 RepID=UPI002D80781B|nr:outer membrane protein assembly factor BamB [Xylophilus sp.]
MADGSMTMVLRSRAVCGLALAGAALALAGCSYMPSWLSSSSKPKPAELGPIEAKLAVRQIWTARVGQIGFPLQVHVDGASAIVASEDGTVTALDTRNGQELWRASVGAKIAAGVGSDGKVSAVLTRTNEVVALAQGQVLWRQKLPAQGYTVPLVAGERVFVVAADRSIAAFDGRSGRRLWSQQRPGEPLVLSQPGVLIAVGDTLVTGFAGRLTGLNPGNGTVRWEAPIATPRGTNDVERLVELVANVSRSGDVVCARAFQAAVGCVNTLRGQVLWSKTANGATGVSGDGTLLFGTESNGTVVAWRQADGEKAWTSERLQYRSLTAPLLLGRAVVIGDSTGTVHLLSREDGSPLNRLVADGSAIAAAPVSAGDTLVLVTDKGTVYGFRPN